MEHVDLSHNLLPVLTYDITFGTKKLKSLNLSSNSINDIRKFVIGNLTALEVLDLSDNKLSSLSDPDAPFDLAENVTHLLLQNNELFKVDYDKIKKLKHLKEINLENNQLSHLNKTLIDAIKSGVSVKFSGNPLVCNCEIQSLKHFLLASESPPEQYTQLICKAPRHVDGNTLQGVDDRQLTCSDIEKSNIQEFNHDYEILPDIRLRDIFL